MDEIVTDQKILQQISKETSVEEITDLDLINRLKEAMKSAWCEGCGLAAIQIGVPLRAAFLNVNGKEEVLINPEIVFKMGYQEDSEGCLSVPEKYYNVTRSYEIEYLNNGKKKRAKGFKARVIQHEIDHMDGKTIVQVGNPQ